MLCGACWMPRSSRIETLLAPCRCAARPRARAPRRRRTRRRSRRRRCRASAASTLVAPSACSREEVVVEQVLLHEHAEHRGEQKASVPGRTCRWMSASSAVSVRRGSTTISVALGSSAIALSVGAGAREAVRLPRVLADEDARPRRARSRRVVWQRERPKSWPSTQNSPVFSCASALECSAMPSAARVAPRVGAAEVVALPAAAVVEDRLAAVLVAHRARPRGDLGDRRVPVDLLERAVGAPAQRRRQPVRGRSGSRRGAGPSRTRSPSSPGAPCRP